MINETPPVAILMGSQSDWGTLRHSADTLDSLGIAHDDRIISAHRTPDRLITFAKGARRAGYKIIIVLAGMHNNLRSQTQIRLEEAFLGFKTTDARVTAHSIAGSFIYGVFAVKVFFVHDRAHPRWTLPVVGGTLFATLATLWVTSAYWYFTNVRFGF